MKSAFSDWDHMLAVHARLAELALARDAVAATELAAHIGKTAEHVLALLEGRGHGR
jgi:hypothetical protein